MDKQASGYFSVKNLAEYCGLGASTIRRLIANDGLPHFRLPGAAGQTGRILIRIGEFNDWIERFRANDFTDPEAIADEVIKSLSDE